MSLAAKLEVMVVDDTSVSRMLITEALNQIGISKLSLAKDGKQALAALMTKARPPRHIRSEHAELDGLGLLKALREFKPTSRIGFISSPALQIRRSSIAAARSASTISSPSLSTRRR